MNMQVLSQAAIGRALDLSPAAMTKLKKQGMPVDSVQSAQAWRVARQNVAARKPTPTVLSEALAFPGQPAPLPVLDRPVQALDPRPAPLASDESHDMARTRREIAEANLAELKLAELNGRLVDRDAMRSAHARSALAFRDALLQLGARLAPLLAAETDQNKVQQLIDAEHRHALQQFSESGAA